jgi:hypothetical protein
VKRTPFVLGALVLPAGLLACGQLLDLGQERELWPPEGGAPPPGLAPDASGGPDARDCSDASDAAVSPEDVAVEARTDGHTDGPSSSPPDANPDANPDADVSAADTEFPAVGFVTGITVPISATHAGSTTYANERLAATTLSCSGVLIAARSALTLTSCLGGDLTAIRFAMNATGDALSFPEHTIVYAVDHVHATPTGHAVLHLAVASDQPDPTSLAKPMVPLTGTDGVQSPFGWHAAVPLDAGPNAAAWMASWRIEGTTTVVRRAHPGTVAVFDDTNVELSLAASDSMSAGDVGAPGIVLAAGRPFVIGSLDQSSAGIAVLRSTFGSTAAPLVESALWLTDDDALPGLRPPPPAGAYTWTAVGWPLDPWPDLYPTSFYAAGSETNTPTGGTTTTRSLGVCTTWNGGQQIPGKYFAGGGCIIAQNRIEYWPPTFKVLNVQGSATWPQATNGAVLPGSFAAGYDQMVRSFACRGSYQATSDAGMTDGVHPGVVRLGACHITYGGQEIPLTDFQTLILGP